MRTAGVVSLVAGALVSLLAGCESVNEEKAGATAIGQPEGAQPGDARPPTALGPVAVAPASPDGGLRMDRAYTVGKL